MDTPIDDVLGAAFDDQVGAVQSDDTKVVTEPKVSDAQIPAVESKTEETQEEVFTNKPVDPESLPEELKAIYKSWQQGYTQKRQAEKQELAEIRAELERLRSQPNDNQENSLEDAQFLTPEEHARRLAREVFNEEKENAWVDEAKAEYLRIDERLNDESPFHDPYLDEWLQNKLDAELEAFEEESGSKLGFDYKSKAKELIQGYDQHVEKLVTGFVQKQKELSKEKADKSKRFSPEVSAAKGQKAGGLKSIDEALEDAFNES